MTNDDIVEKLAELRTAVLALITIMKHKHQLTEAEFNKVFNSFTSRW